MNEAIRIIADTLAIGVGLAALVLLYHLPGIVADEVRTRKDNAACRLEAARKARPWSRVVLFEVPNPSMVGVRVWVGPRGDETPLEGAADLPSWLRRADRGPGLFSSASKTQGTT